MSTDDDRRSMVPVRDGERPEISDYWPDLPHRMSPAADFFSAASAVRAPAESRNRPTVPLPVAEPRPKRQWPWVAALALLVVAGAAAVVVLDRRSASGPPPVIESAAPPPPFRITAPLDGRDSAVLVLSSDAAAVRVRTGATDADLFRASSPRGGSVRPTASVTGETVRLELAETDGSGAGALDVQLSGDVRWRVRIDAAINNADIDLSRAAVGEVELAGDAADVALRLPAAQGVLSVRVTGGINRLRVASPGEIPVRVRAGGGMGRAVIGGTTYRGVARGEVFETGRWRQAADKVEVNARVGLGEITVSQD